MSSKGSIRKAKRGGEPSVISTIKYIKSQHVGRKPVFVIKPVMAGVKRSPTVPSLKALAVLFSYLHNSGYVKNPNEALPLHTSQIYVL